ncbi:MAG: tRNA threonylcarbamoyladenosine dehydratase [Clostridia bacterium]|nr:tRNA threonylcarbamoyladenosine dehydratase [Clostridia bacterium]
MDTSFLRTQMLIGEENLNKLVGSRVAVFGVGGVGGYVVEALARCAVGAIDVFDNDVVDQSNINRQIIATVDTVGRPKVDVIKERILSINPKCKVTANRVFFLPDNADEFDFSVYDYVVDAVDTVTAKIAVVMKAKACGCPVISCMGTGNKTDPTRLEVADIYQTSVCPLAKVMRSELKKRGVDSLKVVYSKEQPITPAKVDGAPLKGGRPAPASIAFVPSVAGLIIASQVVNDIIK